MRTVMSDKRRAVGSSSGFRVLLRTHVSKIWQPFAGIVWAPERRPSNLRKDRLPRKVVSRQNQLHRYTQQVSVSVPRISDL